MRERVKEGQSDLKRSRGKERNQKGFDWNEEKEGGLISHGTRKRKLALSCAVNPGFLISGSQPKNGSWAYVWWLPDYCSGVCARRSGFQSGSVRFGFRVGKVEEDRLSVASWLLKPRRHRPPPSRYLRSNVAQMENEHCMSHFVCSIQAWWQYLSRIKPALLLTLFFNPEVAALEITVKSLNAVFVFMFSSGDMFSRNLCSFKILWLCCVSPLPLVPIKTVMFCLQKLVKFGYNPTLKML